MTSNAETLAAVLTPAGHGAIATLALWGPDAWGVVRDLFRPRGLEQLPETPEPGRLWLGEFGSQVVDQVVVSAGQRRQLPWVEVHCHGGPEVIRLLLDTIQSRGVRITSWKDLERGSTSSPLRALAASALSAAQTVRTAAILLDQHAGALDDALAALLTAWKQGDRAAVERLLGALVRYAPVGRHLTTPWRVVVAGAPNVGKSSLVNALAGFQRCIVSATPGTTRDLVTTTIALDGWPVELVDTAGLRDDASNLEAAGIGRARAAAAGADVVVWVLDAAAPPVWPDDPTAVHCVVNKVDLPAAWDLSEAKEALHVSAATGAGLAGLCQALTTLLVPEPPPPGAAVPFTSEMCARMETAWQTWKAGRPDEAYRKCFAADL